MRGGGKGEEIRKKYGGENDGVDKRKLKRRKWKTEEEAVEETKEEG